MHSIEEAIAAGDKSLRDAWTGEQRTGVIELVRVMDLKHLAAAAAPTSKSDSDLDWLYVNGYPRVLQTFIDDSTSNSGYPLFRSTPESQAWAAWAIQHAGRTELFRRVLSWCRAGLATLRSGEDGIVEVLIAPGAGVESVEREDHAWLSRLTDRIQKGPLATLAEKQSYIDGLMMTRVYPWRTHFIGYDTTPEIDSHFEALGILYAQRLIGQDSFPGTAIFDGVPFDAYRAVTAALIGWSIKHLSFCQALLRKNPSSEIQNVITIVKRLDELVGALCNAVQIQPSDALRAVNVLTMNRGNVAKHYAMSAGSAPPLIAIGDEFVLVSAYGLQSSPFSFMLSGLRRNWPVDWDRAVGLREAMFRGDLYNLFKWADVLTMDSVCRLRTAGQLVTDIDAVVFHRPTRTAGLFQLKWQDLFGESMRTRAVVRPTCSARQKPGWTAWWGG